MRAKAGELIENGSREAGGNQQPPPHRAGSGHRADSAHGAGSVPAADGTCAADVSATDGIPAADGEIAAADSVPAADGAPTAGGARAAETDRVLAGIRALHDRLGQLEGFVAPVGRVAQGAGHRVTPAWKRATNGEARWQVTLAIVVAITLQSGVPDQFVLRPGWLLPTLQIVLGVVLLMANPRRISRQSRLTRVLSLTLVALLSLANAWSAGVLVLGIVNGTATLKAPQLILTGGAIWLTNIIVFGMWYWEFDRGGPVARANATHLYPDFQFVQMVSPEMAPPEWEPMFGDYLYLSFTNAAAFSPTDVMPLSRWAKIAMMLQSIISIITVALVIARAVNIL
ncbi:MAG: hypothetical protein ACLPUO_19645 [Streptosporangiaceae bacterium]